MAGVGACLAFALVASVLGLRAYTYPSPELPCDVDLTAEAAERELNSSFRLSDITPFEWSSVAVFGEYDPVEEIRAKTGHPYVGNRMFGHVPECVVVLIFDLGTGKTCEASLERYSGRYFEFAGTFNPTDPHLIIREEGHDPRFTNCGPLEE